MQGSILIVEDEPAIADTIQFALESEGFQSLCSDTGLPVEGLLREHDIDLIILDVGLPDINGFELCKRIRKEHDTPIIFLTARAEEIDRVVGLEIGGDDYVTKPFSPRELSARVKAILRRLNKKNSQQEYGLSIDEARRRICYLGEELQLSHHEYAILTVLARRPGQVFSRDQIMQLAWEEPEASMDRTVDAHIKNLRAKLKTVRPNPDPIVTHRGSGYALREGL